LGSVVPLSSLGFTEVLGFGKKIIDGLINFSNSN